MRTRDQIIDSMCLTWRHDYGLEKSAMGGMTHNERESLRRQMAHLFDNDIAPFMEFRKEPRKTELVHDGIIKMHSFKLSEREQKRISLGLKYGPASAAMRDDGTFFESPDRNPFEKGDSSWIGWVASKFLWRR